MFSVAAKAVAGEGGRAVNTGASCVVYKKA